MHVEVTQGSEAWHQFRLTHFGGSEAAAMLGLSPYMTRSELLHMKATGLPKEYSDWFQEKVLDHGHAVEAQARPLAEEDIEDELYPVTHEGDFALEGMPWRLSASLDGQTLDDRIAWEHKQWNEALVAAVRAGELPDSHMPQCQQELMVSGAKRLMFTVSDGTKANKVSMWVSPDAAWFERIRAGWAQFAADLRDYAPREHTEKPVAESIMALPALVVQTEGKVVSSNLVAYKVAAERFIANIKTKLETDDDFANAEATVKFCGAAEADLEQAKAAAIAQTSSIDEVLRTVDHIKNQLRDKRLTLEKLVARRKIEIKETILNEAKRAFGDHIATLEAEIAPLRLQLPQPDFAGAMKNKRTLASLNDAVDTLLANAKITASTQATDIRAKQAWCREHAADYRALFMDMQQLISKPMDDFQLVVRTRIADHQRAEAAKAEALRAQIAAEEKAKAEAAAKAKLDAELAAATKAQADAEAAAHAATAAETKRQLEHKAAQANAQRATDPDAQRQRSFYGEQDPAEVSRLQALADQNVADKREFAQVERVTGVPVSTRPYPAAGTAPAAMLDAADTELYPSDEEIIELMFETFGMTTVEAVERLAKFDVAAARAALAVAA